MGKFGIGARVRDDGGDDGVIVEKRKGMRLVKYDYELYGTIWNQKDTLLALPANDNVSADVSENAYPLASATAISGQFVNTTNGDTAVVEGDADEFGNVRVRYTTGERSRLPASWLTAWVPKVGERVRFNTTTPGYGATYFDGEIEVTAIYGDDASLKYRDFDGKIGKSLSQTAPIADLEPVVAPATTASTLEVGKTYRDTKGKSVGPLLAYNDGFIEVIGDGRMWRPDGRAINMHANLVLPPLLTIEAGKFYRTRDGRKVGPAWLGGMEGWPWSVGNGVTYKADGMSQCNGRPWDHDIVAEWVEPPTFLESIGYPPVAVAEATATPWGGTGSPGLAVRCEEWGGELFTPGRVYTFDANGEVAANDGSKFEGIWAGKFSIVEPATPPAKFKVGDRVVIVGNSRGHDWLDASIGNEITIDTTFGDGGYAGTGSPWWWPGADLVHVSDAPTFIRGQTVTFTATGRLSAINENGHYQVTFPGLPAGRNSFALPADYVTAA